MKKMWQKLLEMRLCVMRYILALVCLTFTPKLTQGHFQCEQFLMKKVLLPLLRWIIHSGMSNIYIFVFKLVWLKISHAEPNWYEPNWINLLKWSLLSVRFKYKPGYKFECSHWLKYSLQSECCNFNQWEESNL